MRGQPFQLMHKHRLTHAHTDNLSTELSKALTAANLPPIVQKALINNIQNEADRSDTQWVVDTESPSESE